MTIGKRLLDLMLAILLTAILWPVIALVALLLLVREGRPVFYIAERMKTPDTGFGFVKFRTMQPSGENAGVTGGDKSRRMSDLQRTIRRLRVDELPQLWNVIRGDLSLVGPRPPLRVYVEAYPEIYSEVLKSRPGITGLASLVFASHEERILSHCATPKETDAAYRRRCIPRKARLDLIYARRRTICLDLVLIAKTAIYPFTALARRAPANPKGPRVRGR